MPELSWDERQCLPVQNFETRLPSEVAWLGWLMTMPPDEGVGRARHQRHEKGQMLAALLPLPDAGAQCLLFWPGCPGSVAPTPIRCWSTPSTHGRCASNKYPGTG